ncbi:nucleotide-diphospho-sugar transferase [Naematelia encephala]|uniref:Nucleotide-diphospho-sugar transferase n=1 Tax=Naematelia encephala TaxID=71784 RepID=A0A1Y2B4I5_9TREE|nr:nucleotide-diphospho-sugar transferase [Naematelia encephala]
MSFSIRTNRHHETPTSRSRKLVITLLILLSLFLLGTVIVLSSVSYYLAIPSGAYLTEEEVPWRLGDAIAPLKYRPDETSQQHKRQDWDNVDEVPPEMPSGDSVMGADEIAEVWEQLGEVDVESDAELDDSVEAEPMEVETEIEIQDVDETVWDVDGRGSGDYWMRKDWDGRVKESDSWHRLFNVTTRPGEKIPRLIHQTWKDDQLPSKWRKAWKECREGMPDYEYMLWTDDLSREFIATYYPAHLHMFDSYKYPIQRADSIRYFVLLHFGGIYMDLDIGCRRRLDSLLQGDWEVILPLTKPVGVSNDLIFSSKGSAFMDDTVHALAAWNHEWITNYPTVMFSTGPMFLSGQYSIYTSAHPITPTHPRAEVRILPKSLYGKNIAADLVPHSFFTHFYGSSWHADDAGFITFLGAWGKGLMYIGGVVIILGLVRLVYHKATGGGSRQYQLLSSILPTSTVPGPDRDPSISPTSSSLDGFESHPFPQDIPGDIASVFRRAGNVILAAPATLIGERDRRSRRRTGLLYFVPAIFQPGPIPSRRGRTASEASRLPLRTRKTGGVSTTPAPPPYERVSSDIRVLPPQVGQMEVEGEGMEEVDAFLKESWAGSSTEGEGDYEGESESRDGQKGWEVWKERR